MTAPKMFDLDMSRQVERWLEDHDFHGTGGDAFDAMEWLYSESDNDAREGYRSDLMALAQDAFWWSGDITPDTTNGEG